MSHRSKASCVACGGPLSLFGRRLSYNYHRCGQCGTLQLWPLPDQAQLAQAYASQYATAKHHEGDPDVCRASARTYYQSIVQLLKDYEISGTVVDYGAGWGGLCEMLIKNGFLCQGLEISNDMVTYCQRRGLPVQYGDLTALAGEGKISALVLCTVFEHLVNHDVWLLYARRLIKQSGLLVTLQPTAPFAHFMAQLLRLGNIHTPLPPVDQVFCPPWHAVLFSLEGMRALMSKNGFELLEIRPAPQGRMKSLMQVAQIGLEMVNRVGWRLFGKQWPFLTAHIFVFRKIDNIDGGFA